MKRRQAGFTLTELMVVVAIIGVMVTMAIVYMRPRVRPIDVATRVGDLVREASRRAVALGPVRASVAGALNSKARTQILAATSAAGVAFTLYRMQEDQPVTATTGTWMPIETYTVDPTVLSDSWAPGVVDHTSSSITTNWPGFVTQCKPDGTCDSRTLFFQAAITGPSYEQLAKVTILQLGGAITTRTDWN